MGPWGPLGFLSVGPLEDGDPVPCHAPRLAPGEAVDAHSSGGSREIVYCLDGAVAVRRGSDPTVALQAGEMTYVPPGTGHEPRNASDRPAAYLFVFARECEAEPVSHGH
jgi:quercetin dioxygenase-like cupin family protein